MIDVKYEDGLLKIEARDKRNPLMEEHPAGLLLMSVDLTPEGQLNLYRQLEPALRRQGLI